MEVTPIDIQLIKQRINCIQYAQRIGLSVSKPGDRCISPLRQGAKNKTSFVVYEEFFYDFGAALGGDVIEFCSYYAHDGNRGAAIRELAAITGVETSQDQEWVDYTHHMNAMTAYYHAALTDADRAYLHSRGIQDADIDRLKIGRVTDGHLRGRLFLPYFSSGGDPYVCYYATRVLPESAFPDSKYMKQKRDEHCQHVPWGLHTLSRDGDTLVIAEGYFDAASFEVSGYPVLSAITGHFSKDQLPTVLSAARSFKRVFLVYDNDPTSHAGEKFTQRMARILLRHRIPFIIGTVPAPYHDISDYYAAGNALEPLIVNAQDGLHYLISRITEFSELEQFCYSVCRHIKRTQLEELFTAIIKSERFNDRAVKSLYKSCTTAPPETIVADEIIRDHQLKFIHGVGFYEYSSGYWQHRLDGQIRNYVDDTLGEFATAQRVAAITRLVADRTLSTGEFNTKPVWNFINGTLELDTGVFRDHNPGDMCSIQASYPYDPDATCPHWEQFIRDIMDDRPVEMELLQFIPAYVLFQDNPHEKIFYLTGEGANGKSRYTMILRKLFEPSVTNLTPREFTQKFDLIRLRDSVLNIAGEIRSDLSRSEESLKAISSGETISACYKGKDVIEFEPRAKLLFAGNGKLTSEDTSDGLARRLIIVDFPMRFVEIPRRPNERLVDIHLMDKLLPELSGIFNWVYRGYQLLRTVGYFTMTNNQVEMVQEFKRSSNPVLSFWEEQFTTHPPELENKQLYSDYRAWCAEAGVAPLGRNTFLTEFTNVSAEVYTKTAWTVRRDGQPKRILGYKLLQSSESTQKLHS